MGRRRAAASVGLTLLGLVLVGVAVVAVSWWPVPSVLGRDAGKLRPVSATVIRSAPCGASTEGDLLEMTVDGKRVQARFDGCGHRKGQQLRVRVPAEPGGEFTALPAAPGSGGEDGSSLRTRLSWVLVTLAGVAGGGYALMLRWRPV